MSALLVRVALMHEEINRQAASKPKRAHVGTTR